MKYCKNCGKPLGTGGLSCLNCGYNNLTDAFDSIPVNNIPDAGAQGENPDFQGTGAGFFQQQNHYPQQPSNNPQGAYYPPYVGVSQGMFAQNRPAANQPISSFDDFYDCVVSDSTKSRNKALFIICIVRAVVMMLLLMMLLLIAEYIKALIREGVSDMQIDEQHRFMMIILIAGILFAVLAAFHIFFARLFTKKKSESVCLCFGIIEIISSLIKIMNIVMIFSQGSITFSILSLTFSVAAAVLALSLKKRISDINVAYYVYKRDNVIPDSFI